METFARFETDSADRYLTTLCTHFGRKVEVGCAAGKGFVKFPFGRCDMTADEVALTLHARAEDRIRLDQVEQIVTSHLERYAFRENPSLCCNSKGQIPINKVST